MRLTFVVAAALAATSRASVLEIVDIKYGNVLRLDTDGDYGAIILWSLIRAGGPRAGTESAGSARLLNPADPALRACRAAPHQRVSTVSSRSTRARRLT